MWHAGRKRFSDSFIHSCRLSLSSFEKAILVFSGRWNPPLVLLCEALLQFFFRINLMYKLTQAEYFSSLHSDSQHSHVLFLLTNGKEISFEVFAQCNPPPSYSYLICLASSCIATEIEMSDYFIIQLVLNCGPGHLLACQTHHLVPFIISLTCLFSK